MSEFEKKQEEVPVEPPAVEEAPKKKRKTDAKIRTLVELGVLLVAVVAVCIVGETRKLQWWCLIRANLGSSEMQYRVGDDYAKRNDREKAKKYLGMAAAKGHAKAAVRLCDLLDSDAEREKLLLPFAEKGDPDAQCVLARCFERDGKKKEAEKWFREAAKNGDGEAAVTLADVYLTIDLEKIHVLLPAANKGDAEAQLRMADCCFKLGKDAEAAKWCEKAAGKGDVEAQLKLADFLHRAGRNEEAAKWFEKAAENDDPRTISSLAHFYSDTKRYDRLVRWYEQAAEKGSANAQYALGLLYFQGPDENGDGIPQDLGKAKEWMQKAVAQGHPRASDRLAEIEDAIRKKGGKTK